MRVEAFIRNCPNCTRSGNGRKPDIPPIAVCRSAGYGVNAKTQTRKDMKNTTEMLENDSQLDSYKDAPWCSNPKAYQNIVHEDEKVIVFKDRYPVTKGHLLFVPKKKLRREDITICFEYAYKWGIEGVMNYSWEAFNVGINNGEVAGQSVMWPHVHLIPRRKGDTPNPRGGIRNIIPLKGDYIKDIKGRSEGL